MLSGALDATRRDDWQHACSRRGVLTALVSSVLGLTLLPAWRAGAAEAPVALPDKVQQFARLLADRQAWTALGQALRKRTDAVSDGEWHSIQVYLRQLYQDAAVLDAMAAARPASEGPLRALASEFRQRVRQLDGPAKQRDKEAFLQGHARTVEVLGRFLERWQASSDVPAEL
ncbi:hypothetical protein CDCA_CDCA05G1584 [Cyanidium caldarium]|uniref:Photosystem II protein PsbQ n=1 Tax=Cyanidium caldarium TaxID=2771 RepID=A0AAV9ITE2_CYACA|nr:hypothetical protein CDCA_CDCA05G1584 [Cyanidium caldarium]